MKVLLCLVAVFYTVLADQPTPDPCLQACKATLKAKMSEDPKLSHMIPQNMMSPEGRTKMRQMMKSFINFQSPATSGHNPSDWPKLCPIYNQASACINACPESQMREGAHKFLSLFKLGCDNDFTSSAACLHELKSMPSETCKTKCTPFAAKLLAFINERDADPQNHVPANAEVLESGCKYMNCRLNCRKNDITTKCGEKGFESAKKLYSAVSQFSKAMYKRAGGTAEWPNVCKADQIIAAHEY